MNAHPSEDQSLNGRHTLLKNAMRKTETTYTDVSQTDVFPRKMDIAQSNVFDALPIGIIQLNLATSQIEVTNQIARDLLNLPAHTTSYDYSGPDTADWAFLLEVLLKQETIHNCILKLPLIGRWVSFSSQHTTDSKVVAFLQDITDLKQENEELQRVNTELDNFVYHASHDLRTPLRSMLGLLSLLKNEPNEKEREKCVELIEGSILRLDTFITDLLSISRSHRKGNPLIKINMMVEVNTAVANAYHMGNTENLEIILKISQPYAYVSNLTRVRIILNNLISNAIKYRRYDAKEKSRIVVSLWVDPQALHLTLEDNGEGIVEDKIANVFDMFYRASERSEGSGLGLYIVKDVVDKLEGTIAVDSKLGVGTTFTLTLPNKMHVFS